MFDILLILQNFLKSNIIYARGYTPVIRRQGHNLHEEKDRRYLRNCEPLHSAPNMLYEYFLDNDL